MLKNVVKGACYGAILGVGFVVGCNWPFLLIRPVMYYTTGMVIGGTLGGFVGYNTDEKDTGKLDEGFFGMAGGLVKSQVKHSLGVDMPDQTEVTRVVRQQTIDQMKKQNDLHRERMFFLRMGQIK